MQKTMYLTTPAGEHPADLLRLPESHDHVVRLYGHPSPADAEGRDGRAVWALTVHAATEAGIIKRFMEFGRGDELDVDHRDMGSTYLRPLNDAAESAESGRAVSR